jgi:putative SOS response-associated peptidase YedK
MCYSAQILQSVRKLYRDLGIRLDYAEAQRLFERRLDEPGISISRGFEANFEEPENAEERRIKAAIDAHRARAATRLEQELFTQKTRLAGACRALEAKPTKKAREDRRIATNKIDSLTAKLADLRRSLATPRDNRIFPFMYAGVIVAAAGERLLTPMRYFCRPAGKPAIYDKKYPGLYNARRDNLERFWAEQFGRDHAVLVVDSFYENVQRHAMEHRALAPGEAPQNVVLQFTPDPPQTMLVACLWSHWTDGGGSDGREPDVRGFAAITDEPPPDVAAAGHDRCIVNLKPQHLDHWLQPQERTAAELQALLSDRAVPVFQHAALQAA